MKKRINIKELITTHKIVFSIIITLLIGYIGILTYNQVIKETTKMVNIPVAAEYIKSRKQITEDDIKYVEVPQYIVLDKAITNTEDIVGKYVNVYDSISEDSLFYEDVLVSKDELKDANLFELDKGEVAITIKVDTATTYSNNILPDSKIDLYYQGKGQTIESEELYIIYGEVVKNVRIIAVKDKNGNNIEIDSENEPSIMVVALSQEDAHLVGIAKALGTVTPILSYDNLSDTNTTNYYDLNKMKDLLLGESLDVTLVTPEELPVEDVISE
jgi:Flp pilus assembly protein CpaB